MNSHSYSNLLKPFSALMVSVCVTGCGLSINQGLKGPLDSASDTPAVVPVPVLVPVPAVVVIPASIPIGADEPVRTAGQTLIWQDDFDSYTTFADANANGWKGLDGANVSDTRATTDPLGANQIMREQPWCNSFDLDSMFIQDGISSFTFGSVCSVKGLV